MSLAIVLEDEHGKKIDEVFDSANVLLRAVGSHDLSNSSSLLKYVDPFGDTIFNALQAAAVSSELGLLIPRTPAQDAELLHSIKEIADRCSSGIHLYMRIFGD